MALFSDFLIIIPARKGSTRLNTQKSKKNYGKISLITIKFACDIFSKKKVSFSQPMTQD